MKDTISNIFNQVIHFGINFKKTKSNYKEIFPIVGFFKSKEKKDLEKLTKTEIKHIGIFEQAFTHRSYIQVKGMENLASNERLEYLGDAILGMLVGEILFFEHNKTYEGDLTKMRSWFVNKTSLAICARELKFDQYLKMSFSAQKLVSNGNETILADVVGAVIAAVYLDSGLEATRNFILQTILPILKNTSVMTDNNYKSILLEKVQSLGHSAPKYLVISDTGKDHNKLFVVNVEVDSVVVGTGTGKNKKNAEQSAAQNAINNFSNLLIKI